MGGFRRSLFVATMALALVAAACGSDDTDDTAADDTPTEVASLASETMTEDDTGPRTVTVTIDADVEDTNAALLGYLPREVTVRQGDTVEFALQPGDPHSVTFGALVDDAFAAMADAPEDGPPPPEVERIPQAFTEDLQTIGAGILPCFSDSPPTDGPPCDPVEQPAFTGSMAFYNSGVLGEPGATFTVPVADDAEPGTYNFFCLIHGPDMSGSLTVVAADGDAPTAEEVAAEREETLAAILEEAQPAFDASAQGTQLGFEDAWEAGGDATILAGGAAEPQGFVFDILTFGPDEVEIAAGGTVRFDVFGFHTISFNPSQEATPLIVQDAEGVPTFNQLALAPQGGAKGMPPPPDGDAGEGGEGGDPGELQTIALDGGAWDGSGFFSSGVLPSFPPLVVSYDVTFTTAGTYPFQCLVHPGMEGTITVTG